VTKQNRKRDQTAIINLAIYLYISTIDIFVFVVQIYDNFLITENFLYLKHKKRLKYVQMISWIIKKHMLIVN